MEDALGAGLTMLSLFGGTALIIWTSTQARIARIRAEVQARQMTATPESDSSVVAELKALQRQMAEMSSTSHQFDISFDAALERMEGRVNRLETKSAASSAAPIDSTQTLRNGQG